MSTGEIISLVAAIAGPLASVICVIVNNASIKRKNEETALEMIQKQTAAAESLKADLDKSQQEMLLQIYRTSIATIHSIYAPMGRIPLNVFSEVCRTYDLYKGLGGNSYIHDMVEDMRRWCRNDYEQ